MRNTPLRAFAKKSPYRDNGSVSDSVSGRTPHVREVKILPKKRETYNPGKDQPKPGKIYDPGKERLNAMIQSNPIATIFAGRKAKKS
jgi:hypothetical protein